MKKLLLSLLLVILTFMIVSCDSYDKRTYTKDAKIENPDMVPYVYTKQCQLSGDQYTYGQIKSIQHFDYNGHSYIQFHISGTHGGRGGIVHDPDCKCNQKDTLK